ncbi:MAG TPA: ABC transporter permease [Longimicrobiales bacterium]|nr:ABC transporter permease [Longimicrobiales bacterium]
MHPRLLLHLLPADLRERHGEEMKALVDARVERAGGPPALGEWVRLGGDVARTWMQVIRSGHQPNQGRREGWMGAFRQDVRHAVRRLTRTPVFTLGAVLIMAVAIGANTAAFTVADRILFTPLPYDEPDRVVYIYQDSDDGEPTSSSFPAYRDLRELDQVFESVAATSPDGVVMGQGEGRTPLTVEFATASLLTTLGLQPTRGRWFDETMDQVGAGHFAVVSHAAWTRRFGADPAIVGRVLELNRQPVTVIGVGPRHFNSTGGIATTDLWLSISTVGVNGDFRVGNLDRREDHWYQVRGRLAPGVGIEQAREAADALALRLGEEFPELNEGRRLHVFPAASVRSHPLADATLTSGTALLMAVVGFVLLLAVTNLGSLLLVRGLSRTPEVAVRRALGAGSRRVAGLFFAEAFLVSLAGGLAGLALAAWLVSLSNGVTLPRPFAGTLDLRIDGSVLAFNLILVLGAALFFGWAPALNSLRTDVSGSLRDDRGLTGGGRKMSLIRNGLVAGQVAVSLVLVVAAALTLRSLDAYGRVDVGVDADAVAVLATDFGEAGIEPGPRGVALTELQDRVRALPGVSDVALATRVPVQPGGTTTTVVESYEPAAGTGSVELPWTLVTPGYFRTLGIPVLAGRVYTPDQVGTGEPMVVVNETAAERFWGGADAAIGRRIWPQGAPDSWRPVVGVVADSRINSLDEPPTPILYYLMGETGVAVPQVLVRTEGDPAALLTGLRAALREVDAGLPVARLSTLEDHLGDVMAMPRLTALILAGFSLMALVLAGIGIYTVVSLSVASRRAEIGLRMALGAGRSEVVQMVVGRVLITVVAGLVLGGLVVTALAPQVGDLLFGVRPLDPVVLFAALAVLAAAVVGASWIPARRAARLDPVDALRFGE